MVINKFIKEMWWENDGNKMDFHIIDIDDKYIMFKNAEFVGYKQELNDNIVVAKELICDANVRF